VCCERFWLDEDVCGVSGKRAFVVLLSLSSSLPRVRTPRALCARHAEQARDGRRKQPCKHRASSHLDASRGGPGKSLFDDDDDDDSRGLRGAGEARMKATWRARACAQDDTGVKGRLLRDGGAVLFGVSVFGFGGKCEIDASPRSLLSLF
jgi:hypothetical protein